MTWKAISRNDLLRWSDEALDSANRLPELLERLIIETGDRVSFLDAPTGTGVSTGGFDLIVEAQGGSLFVPEGVSVWEASVQQGAQQKAENDYAKRDEGPLGMVRGDVHYRAVSTQKWTKRKSFDSHTNDGVWRSVRGLNVDTLVSWLTHAPGTTAWMRSVMGIPIVGQQHWSSWWTRWLESTSVPLDADVLLAGREELVEQVVRRADAQGVTTVGAEGVQWPEIVATFAATAQRLLDSDRTAVLPARLVIFENEEAFATALSSGRPVIALIRDPSWVAAIPENSTAHVFVFAQPASLCDLKLPNLDGDIAANAMEAQGVSFYRAYQLGYLARRDVTTLRRELALQPSLFTPQWAARELDARERRLALLPRWNTQFEGDRRFVAALLGGSVEDSSETWTSIFTNEDRPTSEFENHRYLVSPTDTWRLLSHRLTEADLSLFETEAANVMGTANPLAELEVVERLQAQLSGVRPEFSKDIAEGIGTILALMGASEGPTGSTSAAAVAARTVRRALGVPVSPLDVAALPGRPYSLSLLAEAAPDAVLDYLEAVAEMPAERIFTDARDGGVLSFGPPSPHLELVHAIVTLGWSSDALPRVVSILLRLHEVDPGGRWANRPMETLRDLLAPGSMNTSVLWDRRLAVITAQLEADAGASWEAVAALMDHDGSGTVRPEPLYREWGPRAYPTSIQDLIEWREQLADVLLPRVAAPEHAKRVLSWLPLLGQSGQSAVLDRVDSVASEWTDEQKQSPYEQLRAVIADQTDGRGPSGTLSSTEIVPLRALFERLTPEDPRFRHAWLFNGGMQRLIDFPDDDDWEARTNELQRLRLAAVGDIEAQAGFEGLISFVEQLPDPSTYAWTIASQDTSLSLESLIDLLRGGKNRVRICMSYVARRSRDDVELPERLLNSMADMAHGPRAQLLGFLPIDRALELVNQELPEVGAAFWRAFNPWGLHADATKVETIAQTLIEHGQAGKAVSILDICGEEVAKVTVIDALEGLLQGGAGDSRPDSDAIDRLAAKLQGDNEFRERLIPIEWGLLPALDDRRQLELHHEMARSPAFFIEVLNAWLNPDGGASDRGWKVFNAWASVPGTSADGAIDASELAAWVDEVTERITPWDESKRAIAWGVIGEMLSRTGADPGDGRWPHEAIRQVVNGLRNEALEQGISRGLFNGRGVRWKGGSGGGSELHRATNYREQAAALPADDRTAAVLRGLANECEGMARQEEQRAEARRRGLGM